MKIYKSLIFFYFFITLPIFSTEMSHLIFYHIPKTGGTTITFLLNQKFDTDAICPDFFYYQVENRSMEELKKYNFFRGHFFFKSSLSLLINTKKIVFLRDPIQRVLSEQRFFNKKYLHRKSALYLEHFLPAGDPIDTVSNHQCLFLSSFDRNDPSITPEMHLASAKENLSKEFFFVGITEYFEESIGALYRLMEWQSPAIIPQLNKTDYVHIDDQILEEIRQRNLYDIELYEFAKNLFFTRFL